MGAGRPLLTPLNEFINLFTITFTEQSYRTVILIFYPTGNIVPPGSFKSGITETHTLYPAFNVNFTRNFSVFFRMHTSNVITAFYKFNRTILLFEWLTLYSQMVCT